jgi:hypothetical protein
MENMTIVQQADLERAKLGGAMAKGKQEGLGDELFGTRMGELRDASGPVKGEFFPPPDVSDKEEIEEVLPEQEEFWRPPARFGTVPVEANRLAGIHVVAFVNFIPKLCCRLRLWSALALDIPS